MTSTTNNMVAKIAAAVAGLGLVFSAFAPIASAQSTTTQAQIDALLAQIAALQAQLGGSTSASASMTFTRDLTIGSSGADVTALQNWLISKGHTIAAGATGYFGAQTQAALASYQASVSISPAAGYFGPITRAHVNAMAGGSTGGDTDDEDDEDEDEDEDDGDLEGGEASLEELNGQEGEDDDVEEGQTAMVAEFEFDVEDGDIEIDRLDLGFYVATAADEQEPWETFDTITIYDEDGDELASEDVSDEDEWLDEDEPYVFRFTGLDYVVREGETGMLTVEVEAANSLDIDAAGNAWTIFVDEEGIRGTDGEGIEQYLGETDRTEANLDEEVTFEVVEEGDGEELTVSSSDEDPDSSILMVEDDGSSDEYTIFAFDLEAEEADIELETITVDLVTVGADVDDVLNDAMLVIDGEEFDDWSYAGTSGATTTAALVFDIDGDFTIDADETVVVELVAEFKTADGGDFDGDNTETITASVANDGVTGEGADDVVSDGSANGEAHTLSLGDFEISEVDSSTDRNEAGDVGTFTFEFTIDATDGDVVLANADVIYTLISPTSSTPASADTLALISGDATGSAGGPYTIAEGDDATFSFDVTVTANDAADNGQYRVNVDTIEGVEVDETSDSLLLADA